MTASADFVLQNRLKELDQQTAKQLYDLLKAILNDLDTLRWQLNSHQHAALNAAPTTTLASNNAAAQAALPSPLTLNVSA